MAPLPQPFHFKNAKAIVMMTMIVTGGYTVSKEGDMMVYQAAPAERVNPLLRTSVLPSRLNGSPSRAHSVLSYGGNPVTSGKRYVRHCNQYRLILFRLS